MTPLSKAARAIADDVSGPYGMGPGEDTLLIAAIERTLGPLYDAAQFLEETISWMSGSPDFAENGKAHKGWMEIQPKLVEARKVLAQLAGDAQPDKEPQR